MAKLRVHELAKQVGLSSAEIMEGLASLSIKVKNHMSSLEDKDVEKFLQAKKLKHKASAPSSKKKVVEKKAAPIKETPVEVKQTSKVKQRPQKERKVFQPQVSTLKKEKIREEEKPRLRKIEIVEGTTVKQFCQMVGRTAPELIKMLISLGEMVAINQPMSNEAIKVLAEELGYEVNIISPQQAEEKITEAPEYLEPRPPVITIMGHVDHGKTSLLDAIRKTNVIAEEAGGITQHIGAYQVLHKGKKITFVDTPGHEAFTAMRARGAKVTDVAVLVVAADDGVMPQTIEAIDHARAAKVPIVVAINKIDKPEANPDRVKQQLSEHGLVPEEWGGDTVFTPVSAKQNINLEELLEMIVLVAELLELRANPSSLAGGTVIEARLDRGRGPVATALIQRGTLHVGDPIVAGLAHGRVRAMLDDKGQNVEEATPSQPVEVLGLSTVPQAGDTFKVVADEKTAKQIVEERVLKMRVLAHERRPRITLDDLFARVKEGEVQELNLVIKGDVQGSVEAIKESLEKLDQKYVRLNIIHQGVGAISETDVMLAAASNAIIIGFNVRPAPKAKEMAARENVDLRMYRVIYKVTEDIRAALVGMLKPEFEEVEQAHVEVRATFKVSKVGVVAGSFVVSGEVVRGARARVVRDGVIIHEGTIASLRRFKEDVQSVKAGIECGIRIEDFQDVKVGDIIETFELREKPRG